MLLSPKSDDVFTALVDALQPAPDTEMVYEPVGQLPSRYPDVAPKASMVRVEGVELAAPLIDTVAVVPGVHP
ncbi:MAG: hypothetical protein AAB295_09660 [Chloroflexota bacterium]